MCDPESAPSENKKAPDDPFPNKSKLEALFYIALLILTLITLALALVLRESPQF